jgi:hypothetical protein
LVTRISGTLAGKVNLYDPWTTLTNAGVASDVRVSGGRITYTDTSGNVWAKDGLTGTWYQETNVVEQYAASGSLLITRISGALAGKVNLYEPWTTLTNAGVATDVRVSGNRITYTDTSGNVWAKDGLAGTWYQETNVVEQYAASGALLITRISGTLAGKVNLYDAWTTLTNAGVASDVRVSGNRITYTDTSGNVWAKDGLTGTWYQETNVVDQYAASG